MKTPPIEAAREAPFELGDIVKTTRGARFWGEVVSVYDLGPARFEGEPSGWRCDVRAIAADFAGTIHVYPATQLSRRASNEGSQVRVTDDRILGLIHTQRATAKLLRESRTGYDPSWSDHMEAVADELERLALASHPAEAGEAAVVSVKEMKLSDGRSDFFVSIRVGDREVTPHVFRERFKSEYHVALYDWLLNGHGEEPDVVDFNPDDWPARVASPVSTPEATEERVLALLKEHFDTKTRFGLTYNDGTSDERVSGPTMAFARALSLPANTSGQPVTNPAETERVASRDDRQRRVAEWCAAAFGAEHQSSVPQRGLRFLEEAIEAYQALSGSPEQAHKLIDYIFAKEPGELSQELGGVGVTLLALAEAAGISADAAEQREFGRVLSKPLSHFHARNQAKNDAGFNALAYPVEALSTLPDTPKREGWSAVVDRGKRYEIGPLQYTALMAQGMLVREASDFRLSTPEELRQDPGSAGVGQPNADAVLSVVRASLDAVPSASPKREGE
jgi:hypothetical protein